MRAFDEAVLGAPPAMRPPPWRGLITVTTGRGCNGEHVGDESVCKSMTMTITEEFSPEQVFDAANRVDTIAGEASRLARPWQMAMRILLDKHEMCSMSVGDEFVLRRDDGTVMSHLRCTVMGWVPVT